MTRISFSPALYFWGGIPDKCLNYQYHYGGQTPVIFPLMLDLIPEAGAGGVFARQEAARLIVTWERAAGFYRPQAVFTFQAILYRNGVFEFSYNGLPERMDYRANDEPSASVWVIGAVPGGAPLPPQSWGEAISPRTRGAGGGPPRSASS